MADIYSDLKICGHCAHRHFSNSKGNHRCKLTGELRIYVDPACNNFKHSQEVKNDTQSTLSSPR